MSTNAVFRSGYLTIARYRGVPIRIHWTTPFGAYLFTGAGFVPGAWLGFALLILLHELGHAVLVRAYRFQVVSIDVHAVGGTCLWSGDATERERANIAWGGVLAQIVVLVTTLAWASRFAREAHPILAQLAAALIGTNLLMMVLNLLPVSPFDGAEAWKVLRLGEARRGIRRRVLEARARDIQRQLDELAKSGDPQTIGERKTPDKPTLN